MYRLNHNQDIIQLLLKLKDREQEYPASLLAMRRASFLSLLTRYVGSLVRIYY